MNYDQNDRKLIYKENYPKRSQKINIKNEFCYKRSPYLGEAYTRLLFEYIFNQDLWEKRSTNLSQNPPIETLSFFGNKYYDFPEVKNIKSLISSKKINRKHQGMQLDGWNKELQLAFEHQGIQHYKKAWNNCENDLNIQRKNDEIKKTWALSQKNPLILVQIPSNSCREYGGVPFGSYFEKIISLIKEHPLYYESSHPVYRYQFKKIKKPNPTKLLHIAANLIENTDLSRILNYLQQIKTDIKDPIAKKYGYAKSTEIRNDLGISIHIIKNYARTGKVLKQLSIPRKGKGNIPNFIFFPSIYLWFNPKTNLVYQKINEFKSEPIWKYTKTVSKDGEIAYDYNKYIIDKIHSGKRVSVVKSNDNQYLEVYHNEKLLSKVPFDINRKLVGLNGRFFWKNGIQITVGKKISHQEVVIKEIIKDWKINIYLFDGIENNKLIRIVYPSLELISERGNVNINGGQRYVGKKYAWSYISHKESIDGDKIDLFFAKEIEMAKSKNYKPQKFKSLPKEAKSKNSKEKKVSRDGTISVDGGIYPIGKKFKNKMVKIENCQDGQKLRIFDIINNNILFEIVKNRKKVSERGYFSWKEKKFSLLKHKGKIIKIFEKNKELFVYTNNGEILLRKIGIIPL